jgi:fructose/tagatose bisphosphate aldolase
VDKEQLLTGMVQVISKKVAVDTECCYTSTELVQKKHRKNNDKEEKEVQKFWNYISSAVSKITKTGMQENLKLILDD